MGSGQKNNKINQIHPQEDREKTAKAVEEILLSVNSDVLGWSLWKRSIPADVVLKAGLEGAGAMVGLY